MRYQDLGKDFEPLPHALVFTGVGLEHAMDRGLIGLTRKTLPEHPDPTYYVAGDLWLWIRANLGETWDGQWKLSFNLGMKVVEIRFRTKQQAMQCKLMFGGHPVLIP